MEHGNGVKVNKTQYDTSYMLNNVQATECNNQLFKHYG